jgi:hypothetical protein
LVAFFDGVLVLGGSVGALSREASGEHGAGHQFLEILFRRGQGRWGVLRKSAPEEEEQG